MWRRLSLTKAVNTSIVSMKKLVCTVQYFQGNAISTGCRKSLPAGWCIHVSSFGYWALVFIQIVPVYNIHTNLVSVFKQLSSLELDVSLSMPSACGGCTVSLMIHESNSRFLASKICIVSNEKVAAQASTKQMQKRLKALTRNTLFVANEATSRGKRKDAEKRTAPSYLNAV